MKFDDEKCDLPNSRCQNQRKTRRTHLFPSKSPYLYHLQAMPLIMECFIAFFMIPPCFSDVFGHEIRNWSDSVRIRFRRQEKETDDNDNKNATASDEDPSEGEYYKDHLDLMGWLKGPLIILGFIVVLSLCLFFMYIYKYRSEAGIRRQSMASGQLHHIRRSTIEPPSPSPPAPWILTTVLNCITTTTPTTSLPTRPP